MPSSRLKKTGLGCFGLLLISGLGLWAARDLPRRVVATVLADQLSAQIRLDRLEILSPDRFLLAGVSITELRDYPFVETLRLEEILVESRVRDLLGNRYDRLTLRGLETRLKPAPAVERPDRPLPVIEELVLEPATIRVAGGPGHDDLQLRIDAVLRQISPPPAGQPGIGAQANGEARLIANRLRLQPFYDLIDAATPGVMVQVLDLDLELAFDPDGAELIVSASSARWAQDRDDSSPSAERAIELARPSFTARRTQQRTELRLAADDATVRLGDRRVLTDGPSAEATITTKADGALRIEVVPRLTWLDEGHLEAEWDPALERLVRFDADLRGLDPEPLLSGADIEATADIELTTDADQVEYLFQILPEQIVLADDRHLSAIAGAKIRVFGHLPFDPSDLRVPVWEGPLAIDVDVPTGRGRWDSLSLPPTALPLTASFDGRWSDLETPRLTGDYRLDSAAGLLTAGGEVTVRPDQAEADLTWAWAGIDLATLTRLLRDAGLTVPSTAGPTLEIQGRGRARGRLRGSSVTGRLELQGIEAPLRIATTGEPPAAEPWRLSGGQATLDWSWAGGRADVDVSRISSSGTFTLPHLEPLALDLEASGKLALNLGRGRLEAKIEETPRVDGQSSGLGSIHLTGGWQSPPGKLPKVSGRLGLTGLDLSRWQRIAKPLATVQALADYQLGGLVGADLEASLAGDTWRLDGPVRLESGGFTSLDGSRVVEGLESPWQVTIRGASDSPIEVEGSGHLGGFLLLWNTYFGDFSEIEASLHGTARFGLEDGDSRPWHVELEGSLPEGPIAAATLESTESDAWRYSLTLDDTDLAATHRRYLAPLLEQHLGRLEIDGKLGGRVRGHYQPGDPAIWDAIGGVEIQNLDVLSGGGQAAVTGLALDLPLDLRRRGTHDLDFSGPRLGGRLSFEHLAVRGLELPPIESDLSVEADSVGLEKPVVLSVLGGAVILERLTLRDLLRSGRHLESGIELAEISLEKISEELELLPMEGALNGRLAGVRLSPTLLSVDGGGELEVFGGTVTVRDISGEDVLSRFPKLELSADLRDIDLGALTRRIDFGEMTGILQGTVEDLELFRGVPVRFSARFETTHRKGVPRTVDVKAVNNITILGTGQRAGVLDRGIQKFFDRYTYQRLGVDMRLERDVLLLRGLERRGDKELFLRGRLPFRIDVVNAQPGKTVSFQAMVGRLKSLDFARATTER